MFDYPKYIKENQLYENYKIKFQDVEIGDFYTALVNFGRFRQGDLLEVIRIVPDQSGEAQFRLRNQRGVEDTIVADLKDEVDMFK